MKKLLFIILSFMLFMVNQINATEVTTESQTTQQVSPIREEILDLAKKLDMDIKKNPGLEEEIKQTTIINLARKIFPKSINKQKVLLDIFTTKSVDPNGFFNDDIIPLSEEQAPSLHKIINQFCKKLAIEKPIILLSRNKTMSNACAIPIQQCLKLLPCKYKNYDFPNIVVITEKFFQVHSEKAIKGVLGHELGHFKHNHTIKWLFKTKIPSMLIQGLASCIVFGILTAIPASQKSLIASTIIALLLGMLTKDSALRRFVVCMYLITGVSTLSGMYGKSFLSKAFGNLGTFLLKAKKFIPTFV